MRFCAKYSIYTEYGSLLGVEDHTFDEDVETIEEMKAIAIEYENDIVTRKQVAMVDYIYWTDENGVDHEWDSSEE